MPRVRVPAIWSVMLLLAAACSGGGDDVEERQRGDPFREITSPIVDIVPAASIGEDGQPVDPALVFAPGAPQITVVAQVGEVTGSPMDITWSQVTDGGEEQLFTHTVEVASFEAAYSVGESPGALTPGTYRVEATLEGEILSTRFEVEAPEGTAAAGEGATSGPPTSGDSGAVGPPVDTDFPETSLDTFLEWAPVDPNAPGIRVLVIAGVPGGSGRVEVKATMGGNTRTASFPTDEDGRVTKALEFDPCVLGGSDLPGTQATFDTTLYEGDATGPINVDFTTLGPDETPPVLEVTSDPPPGSTVEPGQTITVQIVGTETREGTWQTGVRQIKLSDFDTGEVIGDQIFGEQALPCAQKAWSKGLDVFYTVPEDAPPEIRLVAEGFDFAEKRGSFGLSYFTGQVWKGTANIASSAVYPRGDSCQDGWELEFTFVTSAEGTINGQGTADLTSPPTCSFPVDNVPSNAHVDYQVLGEETAGGFSLRFALAAPGFSAGGGTLAGFFSIFSVPASPSGGPPVEIAVSGESGTGQGVWQFVSTATYSANGTITIECVSCEEVVG